MTIDLVNILVKNCLLRILEMAFQQIKIQIFLEELLPDLLWWLSPLALAWNLGYQNILILLTCTQKVGQYDSTLKTLYQIKAYWIG